MSIQVKTQITDFFGTPIKLGSHVITTGAEKLKIYIVKRFGDTYQQATRQTSRLTLYNSISGYVITHMSSSVIVIPDQQMTFHAIKTGGDYNTPVQHGELPTDFFGSAVEIGSYVIIISLPSYQPAIHKVIDIRMMWGNSVRILSLVNLISRNEVFENPGNVILLSEKQVQEYITKDDEDI